MLILMHARDIKKTGIYTWTNGHKSLKNKARVKVDSVESTNAPTAGISE